tara:strand:+ start:508 stop:642 length:135 start_codon:yes stop_codon:yes gene_type:complete
MEERQLDYEKLGNYKRIINVTVTHSKILRIPEVDPKSRTVFLMS